MKPVSRVALTIGVALAALLAGCNKSGDLPKGQVVATVNGTDITIHELNSEITLAEAPPSVPRKTIEQAALGRLVERKMLADVARKQGLDKNPDFLINQRRTDEGLLVQALQSSIAQKVPPVSREAAQKYMADNPAQFGERKVYAIDQIQFLRPANVDSLGLGPAKTLAEVERILANANIEYRRQGGSIDTLGVAPQLSKAISDLYARNPDEIFMFADQPRGAPAPVVYVNRVTDVKSEPFAGERAVTFAQQILQRTEVQKSLMNALKSFRAAAKDKIVYAKGYSAPILDADSKTPGALGATKPVPTPAAPAAAVPGPAATPAATTAPAN